MLVAAALVPETALLLPGAAGAATVLEDVRGVALDAVADLLAARPQRVVVVSRGAAPTSTVLHGRLRPSLVAAGVPDEVLTWQLPASSAQDGVTVHDVAASVGLHLLARAGWTGEVAVALTGSDGAEGAESADGAERAQVFGAGLADGPVRVALLLMGSLSARRGPDGPLPDDPRAAAFDEAVLADLAALGDRADQLGDPAGGDRGGGGRAAARRLADVPGALADELAVSAWAPWQVLLGALEQGSAHLPGTVLSSSAPFGATYVVVSWGLGDR